MSDLQSIVRRWAEARFNDPSEKTIPMATTDSEEVVKSQLTENTGTHFLDSGGAYGRHWEENQEDPPWEQPEWEVSRGFVTHNVYDYLSKTLYRDRRCVDLELALYAYSHDERWGKGDSWRACMEGFAEFLDGPRCDVAEALNQMDVPERVSEAVCGFSGGNEPFTFNTYSGECHGLSQCIQATTFGGPYAGYGMVQVHQGCDVRGGYTSPRVYKADGWIPHELSFRCERCDFSEAESCLYGTEDLDFNRTIDPFELPPLYDVERAHDSEHIDGAVFHCGPRSPGGKEICGGHVSFV